MGSGVAAEGGEEGTQVHYGLKHFQKPLIWQRSGHTIAALSLLGKMSGLEETSVKPDLVTTAELRP